MKKKKIIVLVLQIVIILVSLFLVVQYTNKQISPTEVFVYKNNIDDPSHQITKNDIQKVSVPGKATTKNFVKNKEEIIGKCVDGKVSTGQYAYLNQLIEIEDVDIFDTLDLSKYRKISLPISYVDAFAGNIKKGDTIDLMYVGQGQTESEEADKGFNYSKIFLQDVLVYSVNSGDGFKFIDRSHRVAGYNEDKETIDTETDSGDLSIITLAVTLEEAEQIETRLNSGNIRFVGRFKESKTYNTLGYVLGNYGKIFSGQGFAETDNLMIEEDNFDEIELEEFEDETES